MIGNLGRRKAYWTLPSVFDSTLSFTSLQPNARGERRAKRVRSSALFDADPCHLTALCDRQRCEQLGKEVAQIRETVGWSTEHDDGDGEARQVLLKGKAAVDGDEGFELVLRSRQELAVLGRRPAEVWDRFHVVSVDVAREAS